MNEVDLFRELDRLAATAEASIRQAFIAALDALVREIGLQRVLKGQAAGDLLAAEAVRALPAQALLQEAQAAWVALVNSGTPVVEALPWDAFEAVLARAYAPGSPVSAVLMQGHNVGIRLLPGGPASLSPTYSFDSLARQASEYLSEHGAEFVRNVTAETRGGLQAVLTEGFERPRSQREMVKRAKEVLRQMQPNGLIGLNSDQGERFGKDIAKLIDDPDLSVKQIQRKIDQRFEKLLTERADLIVHTESAEAGNEALVQAWREAERSGGMKFSSLKGDFSGEVVIKGEKLIYVRKRPPAHPRCFCVLRTVRVGRDGEGRAIYGVQWVTRTHGVCRYCQSLDNAIMG